MPTSKPSQSFSGKLWTQTQLFDVQVVQLKDTQLICGTSYYEVFCNVCYFFSAEKFLESVEGNQNYPLLLLTLLEKSQDNVIRVCAAVTFKNYIKRNWRVVSLTISISHLHVFKALKSKLVHRFVKADAPCLFLSLCHRCYYLAVTHLFS